VVAVQWCNRACGLHGIVLFLVSDTADLTQNTQRSYETYFIFLSRLLKRYVSIAVEI
jgi:hypothetical protein